MSSPAAALGSGPWQTSTAQNIENSGYDNGEGGAVSIKPMRLKVLYTFDDQNKTNCLARWPYVLQVQTVPIDETTWIGVVDLKTCIQAIVQSSPELVAKLGQDYTIYAFDYSESDTPLVGQGMLSWALSSASQSPDASDNQSRQLVTGRVCRNIQGLFSNGISETLEVKLRLVPVPSVLQSDYLSSLEKYNQLSKVMPTGFDHKEWYSFLQANPNTAQMASQTSFVANNNSSGQRNEVGLEVVNRMLSPTVQPPPHMDQFNSSTVIDGNLMESRAPTPGGGEKTGKNSRPSSRASVKRPRKPRTKAVAASGNTSGYEEDGDDGPATKKRAKTTKTDWTSKSSFGSASESLRVAASTAGSLRMFRPIAMAPGAGGPPGNHLQEMPRAPTPIPENPAQTQPRDRAPSHTMLRRESMVIQLTENQRPYNSPYAQDDGAQGQQEQIRMSIESAVTSPEQNESPGGTPPDIGSSPPVLRMGSPLRSSPQLPSSPVLPQMPRTDSGFMSGEIDDLFEDDTDVRPAHEEDVAITSKYNRRRANRNVVPKAEVHHGFAIQEVTPGPPELLPTKMLPREDPKQRRNSKISQNVLVTEGSTMSDDGQGLRRQLSGSGAASQVTSTSEPASTMSSTVNAIEPPFGIGEIQGSQSSVPVSQAQAPLSVAPQQLVAFPRPSSRLMNRTASAGSLTLPTVAASDPVMPSTSLQHAHTWSEAPQPPEDFSLGLDPSLNQAGITISQRASSSRAKKQNIRMRLEEAIEKGETPPFCSNCGAIETPTWRKAWARECKGDPGYHEYSDEPGKVTAIDILERDEKGKPVSYKLIKKSLSPDEDKTPFTEILLCNPCGIWMSKYKSQRPEEKWQKDQRDASQNAERKNEKKRRDRQSRAKKSQQGSQAFATSEAYFPSDMLGPMDYETPLDSFDPTQYQAHTTQDYQVAEIVEQPRSGSGRPLGQRPDTASEAMAITLMNRVQSSPSRWMGTQHSPIDIEDDLGSTRRLLFPSPRKDGEPKVLGELAINVVRPATNFRTIQDIKSPTFETSKENIAEVVVHEPGADEELLKLFEEELARSARPSTPPPKQASINGCKTPVRPTPNHRPVTRSQSRSAKSSRKIQMLPQRTPSKTPSTAARRRSPRFNRSPIETPFTATLNKLLSEAAEHEANPDSPSRNLDLGFDFSNLPELGHSVANVHSDLNFQMPGFEQNTDFFSTDFPMPSSPPRLFDLHEDPMALHGMDGMDSTMWSDFQLEDHGLHASASATMIRTQMGDDVTKIKAGSKLANGTGSIKGGVA